MPFEKYRRERETMNFFEMFDKITNVSLQSFEALKRNDFDNEFNSVT